MKPQFIDVHSHVNFSDYDSDREDVIKRALDANVWMINVGVGKEESKSAVMLGEKYKEGLYAIVGQHPTSEEIFDKDFYRNLAKSKKSWASVNADWIFFRLRIKLRRTSLIMKSRSLLFADR